ncbi:hypothetical protein K438DRAFT_1881678 [Mycena galopus ATCC 62051]|nr:hypothetical protein K438DRAFT_1881678 [Mycena galopus ATCC 62051]
MSQRNTPSPSAPHPQCTPRQPSRIIARAQHQRQVWGKSARRDSHCRESRGWCPRHCRKPHQLQPPHSRSVRYCAQ